MGQGLDAILHLHAPHGHRFADAEVKRGCCAFDVLCVQEILSRQAQRFFDGLDPTHYVARIRDHDRPKLDGSMRGSGLGIGARVALGGAFVRSFPGARVGWDRLARKGALYAAVDLGEGCAIDLVNVHLQAGYDPAAGRVRLAQLAHVRALVDEVGARERPFVVCGDFNICGLAASRERDDYRALCDALEGFVDLGAEGDLPTLHPHPDGNALAYALEPKAPAQRIDYVFLRATPGVRCTRVTRFFDRPTASGWPSDHYGVCATLRFDTGV
jgi:endonuclease/exonuclease/phosphatase family metal-dependent hydrolase